MLILVISWNCVRWRRDEKLDRKQSTHLFIHSFISFVKFGKHNHYGITSSAFIRNVVPAHIYSTLFAIINLSLRPWNYKPILTSHRGILKNMKKFQYQIIGKLDRTQSILSWLLFFPTSLNLSTMCILLFIVLFYFLNVLFDWESNRKHIWINLSLWPWIKKKPSE